MIPGLGRSPAEGNSYPLQYSCLGNSMNRGAWKATVHGVTKSCDMTESLSLSQDSLPLNMNKRAGKTTLFRICPFTLNSMSSQPSLLPGASPHPSIPPPGCPLSSPSHPQVGVRCSKGGDAAVLPLPGNRYGHHPLLAAPQQPLLCSR